MGDPFSVAASSAGIISLGLQLSSGLVRYCRAYSSRDEDLHQLGANAERLQSLLSLTEIQQQGTPSPSAALLDSLEKCSSACGACVHDVKSIVQKYARQQRHRGLKEHGQSLIRKLRYPFDKEEFEELRQRLREFNERLVAHLQLLNLELTRELRTVIFSTAADVTTVIGDLGQRVSSLQDTLEHVGSSLPASIQGHLDGTATSLHSKLEETEHKVLTNLQLAIKDAFDKSEFCREDQTSVVLRKIDQVQEEQRNLSLHLASFLDGHLRQSRADTVPMVISPVRNELHEDKATAQPYKTAFIHQFCTCFPIETFAFPRNGVRRRQNHREGCIYAFQNRQKRRFSVQGRILNRSVRLTVDLEYSLMAWARDWRICPNFTIRATVPYDTCPAFDLVCNIPSKGKLGWRPTPQYVEGILRGNLVRLQMLFKGGKAWPTDVLPDGSNLLHIALAHTKSITEDTADIYRDYFCALIDFGVPPDGEADFPAPYLVRTPLDVFLCDGMYTDAYNYKAVQYLNHLSYELEDYGAEYSKIYGIYRFSMGTGRPSGIFDLYGDNQNGILPYILIQKSEAQLMELLQTDSGVVAESYCNGETPLHLAVSWPKGLKLLLEASNGMARSRLETVNNQNRTALACAISLQQVDSVHILISSGAVVRNDYLFGLGEMRLCARSSNCDTSRMDKIICILVDAYIQRRKELLHFALQNLPRIDVTTLKLQDKTMVSYAPHYVIELLRLYGIPFPSYLDDSGPGALTHIKDIRSYLDKGLNTPCEPRVYRIDPVYYWGNSDPFIAQKIWEGGFHRVAEYPRFFTHYVTLTRRIWDREEVSRFIGCHLEAIAWFEEHGGNLQGSSVLSDIYDQTPSNGERLKCTIVHTVARKLAGLLTFRPGIALGPDHKKYLSHLLSYEIADACTCCCSDGGCTPAAVFARWLLEPRAATRNQSFAYIEHIENYTVVDTREKSILDIVRVMTFKELGLTHTCCCWKLELTTDMDEVREIQEEERHLVTQLDELMAELTPQLRDSHTYFNQFVNKVWKPRMKLWEQERDEITEEDRRGFLKIGVVLQEP